MRLYAFVAIREFSCPWPIRTPESASRLEGMVSKHRDRAYKVGRCEHWIKVKNPAVMAKRRKRFDHQ